MDRMNFGATGHDLHLDMPLSNLIINHRPRGLIADRIFPTVDVSKQSDAYTIFGRASALRRDDTKRSPGTEAKRVEHEVSSDTFFCKNYALKMGVTLEDLKNADPVYATKLFGRRAMFITDKLFLDWEIRVANQVNSGSNVGSYAAVNSQWAGSGADPLEDIHTAIDNVNDSVGVRPNRIVFGEEAWRSFRRNSTVRNLIFGTNNGGGYPSVQQVKDLLEMDYIEIGRAFRNSGAEGLGESLNRIWSDNVLVYFAPDNPAQEEPSFGYSFRWAAPGIPNMQVERHPFDTKIKAEEVEVGYYQDEKLTGSEYAFLITNVTSNGSGI